MKKSSADDFYIKICIWTFFCLILAGIFYQIKAVIISAETSANESSAIQTIEVVRRLQNEYSQNRHGNFAPNFYELVHVVNLDEKFSVDYPVIDGYVFTLRVSESNDGKLTFYSINADPQAAPNSDCSSLRHYYYDSTLETIRVTEENRPARPDDPTI